MNFEFMWSVHGRSDILFWEIALPMMAVIIIIFFWRDLGRMFHRLKKRMLHKKIDKVSTGPHPSSHPQCDR
jgi:hypothetical protein